MKKICSKCKGTKNLRRHRERGVYYCAPCREENDRQIALINLALGH